MEGSQEHITAGEFSRAMASLERNMQAGFERNSREIATVSRGVHARLDGVDATTREQGEELAVLRVKVASAEKGNKKASSTWGGAIAGAVMLAAEAIKAAFGR